MKKGSLSAAAITIFLIALNTISVKRLVDNFNHNAFEKESIAFKQESTKRDSIEAAATKKFNHELATWEKNALATQEAKAAIALAERKLRAAKLDTNRTARNFRIANAQTEIENAKVKAFTNYEKKASRPKKKEVVYSAMINPDRSTSTSSWWLSFFIGLLLAGVEYAVIQKSVSGLPFAFVGLIYGGVLLYVHQAALTLYFELPIEIAIGFSMLLTIAAFLNYVAIAEQKPAGGVLYFLSKMKAFWFDLGEIQKNEMARREKLRQHELLEVDSLVKNDLEKYKAEKKREYEELMARLEVEKAIAMNNILREGFMKDAANMEQALDQFFEMEERFKKFGNEYKPEIQKAFTQRLITMRNSLVELPDRIIEKPYSNGKASNNPAPELRHREPAIQFDIEPEILMPPQGIQENAIGTESIEDNASEEFEIQEQPQLENEVGNKRMSDAEMLQDARWRKENGDKLTVRRIGEIYGLNIRQANKIYQFLKQTA
jgi:hypothetical protein